jgi:ADP-ribose pyrophosphatase
MPDKKYEIHRRETLFQGYFRVDRYHVRHERFAGGWSENFTREMLDRGCACAGVLPYDPKSDRLVLIEQFRAGVMAGGEYPWITEIVAGVIDGSDTPEETARREAREEAGCEIVELHKIADFFTSPGSSTEHVTAFIGRTAVPEHGAIRGVAHENEEMRVHVMDATQALSLMYSGKIRDALTLVALQWFAVHHTELRARWLMSDVGTPII